jgi:predicted nucleic acid-binding Zn ribbon protein
MSRTWTLLTTAALSLAPLALAQDAATTGSTPQATSVRANDPDMQQAIQFQRAKDHADARQALKERRHPSVSYDSADRRVETPNAVKDPGERQWKKDKNIP